MKRVASTRARNLLFSAIGVCLALALGSAQANDGPGSTVPSDLVAPSTTLGTNGAPPLQVTSTTVSGSSSNGAAPSVTLIVGATDGGSSGGSSGGDGGPVVTGPLPPQTCFPTPLIILDPITVDGFALVSDPPHQAVVGLPTWFWTDPDTHGVVQTKQVRAQWTPCNGPFGIFGPDDTQRVTLWVDIWPDKFVWNFGDGTKPQPGDCGAKTTPRKCSQVALGTENTDQVQHTYENSSPPDGKGYDVWLSVDFLARIRDNSGNTRGLEGFNQTAHLALVTDAVQSILVPSPSIP